MCIRDRVRVGVGVGVGTISSSTAARRCRSTSSSTQRSSSPTERRGPSSCGRGAGREDAERDRGGGRVKYTVIVCSSQLSPCYTRVTLTARQ
eukprot:scaffold4167_cov95-Phaeocystis_antarctica.AAC.3